jgi:hypothetical protein
MAGSPCIQQTFEERGYAVSRRGIHPRFWRATVHHLEEGQTNAWVSKPTANFDMTARRGHQKGDAPLGDGIVM